MSRHWSHFDPRFTLRQVLLVALAPLLLLPAAWRLSRPFGPAAQDDQIVLRYMAWGNPQQLAVEREIIEQFNQGCAQRGQRVRVELFMPPAGGYGQKLRLMLASGSAPDIMRVDHYDFPSLVPRGYFRDVTELADNDPEFSLSDFHPAAVREDRYRGRLYGVNVQWGTVICYYNKDLFAQALLPDPYELWKQGRWTWDTFEQCAAALTLQKDGKTVQYGFNMPGVGSGGVTNWSWFLWVWGQGGEMLSDDGSTCLLDSPQTMAAFQRYRDLRHRLKVSPTPADTIASAFSFESGNIAMEMNYAGLSPRYRENIRDFAWDVVPTPAPAAPVSPYALVKGNQLVMAATCPHPREAWEFIKYMVSFDVELTMHGDTLRRNVPTRLALLKPPPDAPIEKSYLYATRPFFHTGAVVAALDNAKELPIDATWPIWTREAQKHLDVLFVDPNADTGDICRKAKVAIDRVLARERSRMKLDQASEVSDAH